MFLPSSSSSGDARSFVVVGFFRCGGGVEVLFDLVVWTERDRDRVLLFGMGFCMFVG